MLLPLKVVRFLRRRGYRKCWLLLLLRTLRVGDNGVAHHGLFLRLGRSKGPGCSGDEAKGRYSSQE